MGDFNMTNEAIQELVSRYKEGDEVQAYNHDKDTWSITAVSNISQLIRGISNGYTLRIKPNIKHFHGTLKIEFTEWGEVNYIGGLKTLNHTDNYDIKYDLNVDTGEFENVKLIKR